MSILAAMGQSYHVISEEAMQRAARAKLGPGSAKIGARGAKSGKPWGNMVRRCDAVVFLTGPGVIQTPKKRLQVEPRWK